MTRFGIHVFAFMAFCGAASGCGESKTTLHVRIDSTLSIPTEIDNLLAQITDQEGNSFVTQSCVYACLSNAQFPYEFDVDTDPHGGVDPGSMPRDLLLHVQGFLHSSLVRETNVPFTLKPGKYNVVPATL